MNLARRRRWADEIRNAIEVARDRERAFMVAGPYKKWHSSQSLAYKWRRKRLASLLRRVTQCPECRGSKYVDEWCAGEYYGAMDCPTCNGTGKLGLTPDSSPATQ